MHRALHQQRRKKRKFGLFLYLCSLFSNRIGIFSHRKYYDCHNLISFEGLDNFIQFYRFVFVFDAYRFMHLKSARPIWPFKFSTSGLVMTTIFGRNYHCKSYIVRKYVIITIQLEFLYVTCILNLYFVLFSKHSEVLFVKRDFISLHKNVHVGLHIMSSAKCSHVNEIHLGMPFTKRVL